MMAPLFAKKNPDCISRQSPSFGHHQIHASEKRNGEPAGEGGSGEAEERSDELICEPNGEHAFGAKGETSLTTVAAPQYHSPSAFSRVVSSCRLGSLDLGRFRAHAAFRYPPPSPVHQPHTRFPACNGAQVFGGLYPTRPPLLYCQLERVGRHCMHHGRAPAGAAPTEHLQEPANGWC